MQIEVNWGAAAIGAGFGAIQDVHALIDLVVDAEDTIGFSFTPTRISLLEMLDGQLYTVHANGIGFSPDANGDVSDTGTIQSMEIYLGNSTHASQQIVTFDMSFPLAVANHLIDQEDNQGNLGALEVYFSAIDWIYNGLSQQDTLNNNTVSQDGIPYTLSGNDDLKLAGGDDSVFAGNGNDTVKGGRGEDTLVGGNGNDSLLGQAGDDNLLAGNGNDALKGGGGADLLNGQKGTDFLKGGTLEDTVNGGSGNDRLFGNRGDDKLNGGNGDDTVNGGGNNDTLDGGNGNDLLKGGAGADEFHFDGTIGADRIVDFNDNADVLVLDANLLAAADLSVQDVLDSYGNLDDTGLRLDFGGGNSIFLAGVGDTTDWGSDQILVA